MSCTPPPREDHFLFLGCRFLKGVSYHQCCEIKVWCAKCLVFAQSDCSYRSRHSPVLPHPAPTKSPPHSALSLCSATPPGETPPPTPPSVCSFPPFSCFSCLSLLLPDPLPEVLTRKRAPFLPEAVCPWVTRILPMV